MNYNAIVKEVIKLVGESSNIASVTSCMTRLRISLKDMGRADLEKLKDVEGVLGVKENGDELQLIFGPGKVKKAHEAIDEVLGSSSSTDESFEDTIKSQKAAVKSKRTTRFQGFMSKFSNIFVPLIPGFIAAGMLAGLAGLLKELGVTGPWMGYINVFNKSLTGFMYIMIGYNATKAFGGSGVIGGILAGLFKMTYGGEAPSSGMASFIFDIDPRGGLIGVLIAAILAAYVEKFIRKRLSWEHTDIITTPILTLLTMGIFTFGFIMPLSVKLFAGMNWAFATLNGNPIGGGILATLFLPSVMMGIHQGFVPVYEGLVNSIGMNTLFPILAMAGAGQVGAAIALYIKAPKESKLRDNIRGAIIPGFLGIGEPLIYGVTLPRVKPFFTSMLGGGIGGVYIGILAKLGVPFGLNTVFGSSGLLGSFAMTSEKGVGIAILLYLSALLVAYVAGFILTMLFGIPKDIKDEK